MLWYAGAPVVWPSAASIAIVTAGRVTPEARAPEARR